MKFTLVVTDTRRKNLVFVSEPLQVLSLKDAIVAVREGRVANTYVVERRTGSYIRSKPIVPKLEQLENLAVSGKNLISYAQGNTPYPMSTPMLSRYLELYIASVQD